VRSGVDDRRLFRVDRELEDRAAREAGLSPRLASVDAPVHAEAARVQGVRIQRIDRQRRDGGWLVDGYTRWCGHLYGLHLRGPGPGAAAVLAPVDEALVDGPV